MGNLLSKEEDGKKKAKVADDELPDVYPTSKIYYDKNGNLRIDMKMKRKNIDEEIQRIMEFDSVDEEIDGSTWYIIDASWMNAWLAYTYTAQNVSPRPGPIENQRLIIWDPTAKEWIQRPGTLMASKSWVGDYRRVSEGVWKAFKEMYPGSGPEISCTLNVVTSSTPAVSTNFKDAPVEKKEEVKADDKAPSTLTPATDSAAPSTSTSTSTTSAAGGGPGPVVADAKASVVADPASGEKKEGTKVEVKKKVKMIEKKELKLSKWRVLNYPPPEDPNKKTAKRKKDKNKEKEADAELSSNKGDDKVVNEKSAVDASSSLLKSEQPSIEAKEGKLKIIERDRSENADSDDDLLPEDQNKSSSTGKAPAKKTLNMMGNLTLTANRLSNAPKKTGGVGATSTTATTINPMKVSSQPTSGAKILEGNVTAESSPPAEVKRESYYEDVFFNDKK